jgi:hypothetical protein
MKVWRNSQLATDVVSQLIQKSAKKSCALDPMDTSLMVKSLNELLPVITCMINSSLSLAYFTCLLLILLGNPPLLTQGSRKLVNRQRSQI